MSSGHNLITQIAERMSNNFYELIRQQQQHVEPLRNGLNKVSKWHLHDDTIEYEYIYIYIRGWVEEEIHNTTTTLV